MYKAEFWVIIAVVLGEVMSWIWLGPEIRATGSAIDVGMLMGITIIGSVILTKIYNNLDD